MRTISGIDSFKISNSYLKAIELDSVLSTILFDAKKNLEMLDPKALSLKKLGQMGQALL